MGATIQSLTEFIAAAEKSRKYAANTASAMRSTLRIFGSELTDEEKESLDTFKGHLDQIFRSVCNKNKSKMSDISLETYRRRMRVLLNDYEKYGTDPSKMISWRRESRVRSGGKSQKIDRQATVEREVAEASGKGFLEQSSKVIRFEISLRPDAKAIILTPTDMTAGEVEKIAGYVSYLAKCASK